MYKLKKVVGSFNFSAQFIKIIFHYKKIGYNINVLQQTACLVVNPMAVGNFVFLFNCTLVGRTCDNILGSVELKHYYGYTTSGVLTLYNLYVICNSNRFRSFLFKLSIMIVHTLKMCTGDAGPEQSLVLFYIQGLIVSVSVLECKYL